MVTEGLRVFVSVNAFNGVCTATSILIFTVGRKRMSSSKWSLMTPVQSAHAQPLLVLASIIRTINGLRLIIALHGAYWVSSLHPPTSLTVHSLHCDYLRAFWLVDNKWREEDGLLTFVKPYFPQLDLLVWLILGICTLKRQTHFSSGVVFPFTVCMVSVKCEGFVPSLADLTCIRPYLSFTLFS